MSRASKFVFRNLDFSSSLKAFNLDDKLASLQDEIRRRRIKRKIFSSDEKDGAKNIPSSEEIGEGFSASSVKISRAPSRSRHIIVVRKPDRSARNFPGRILKIVKAYANVPKVNLNFSEKESGVNIGKLASDFFLSVPLALVYFLRFAIWIANIIGFVIVRIAYLSVYVFLLFAEAFIDFLIFLWRLIAGVYRFFIGIGRFGFLMRDYLERAGEKLDGVGARFFYSFARLLWSLKAVEQVAVEQERIKISRSNKGRVKLVRGWYKKEIIFLLVAIGLTFPILSFRPWSKKIIETKGVVLGEISRSLESRDISQIRKNFEEAGKKVRELGMFTGALINVTSAGENATLLIDAGRELAMTAEILKNLEAMNGDGRSLLDKIEEAEKAFEKAGPHLKIALKKIQSVDAKSLPSGVGERVSLLQERLPPMRESLETAIVLSRDLLKILGQDGFKKRYLLVFQNNNELRPTGGFMGSIALIDVKNGKVVGLDVPQGGTYDFQGQLRSWVAAPQPLWLVSPRWELQDSNWWPSFPDSAKKILWFWEKSHGPTADGVIAVNATFAELLLKILGPVTLPSSGQVINPDKFIETIQEEISKEKTQRGPKKILTELSPIILDRLINSKKEEAMALGRALAQGLAQKEILFYFADPETQEHFEKAGLAGSLKNTEQDYLMAVISNIQGGKTDSAVKQKLDLEVSVNKKGEIINTLTIRRRHEGEPGSPEGINNVSYVRFYAPLGSELLEADGFNPPPLKYFEEPSKNLARDPDLVRIESKSIIEERSGTRISEEFGRTVFGNWMQVEPGSEAEAMVRYKLPFKIEGEGLLKKSLKYTLYVQKQSGMRPQDVAVKFKIPQEWELSWHSSSDNMSLMSKEGSNYLEGLTDLSEDAYFGVAISK